MNTKNSFIIIIIVLALVVVINLLVKSSKPSSNEKQEITIGLIAPLSGDAASYGEPVLQGAQLAVEEINSNPDSKFHLTLNVQDGKCSGKDAINAFNQLMISNIRYVVAGSCSSEVLAIAPLAEAKGVIVISPFASSPEITTAGDFIYRTAPSDAFSGVFMAQDLKKKYSSVAIISEETDFAQGLRQVFVKSFKEQGGTIAFDESFTSDAKDFSTLAAKIAHTKADAIFINPQSEKNMLLILKELHNQNVSIPRVAFFLTGEAVATSPYATNLTMYDIPTIPETGEGKIFKEKFLSRYQKEASYPYAAGSSYEDTMLLAKGLSNMTDTSDTKQMQSFLNSVKNYKASIGTFSFDTNGDIEGIGYVVKKIIDGKFIAE